MAGYTGKLVDNIKKVAGINEGDKLYGYTGKILRIDLTNEKFSIIDTKPYVKWGGGHGIGSALFWDYCTDKTVDGFDPKNVVTIMTSPTTGTVAPSVAARTEMQGIGVQGVVTETDGSWKQKSWFTRGNIGGQFGSMLKFAGWDGIILEGKAKKHTWIDIRNDQITFRSADDYGLWGKVSREAQQRIQQEVEKDTKDRGWQQIGDGRTTAKAAVMTIGPAGENLVRFAGVMHGGGATVGQGGFGAVWGGKNLKAISVIGTGSVEIADPAALLKIRMEVKQKAYNVDTPLITDQTETDPMAMNESKHWTKNGMIYNMNCPGMYAPNVFQYAVDEKTRAKGCYGCFVCCKRNSSTGRFSESICVGTGFMKNNNHDYQGQLDATLVLNNYGINAFYIYLVYPWLISLYKRDLLGKGKKIHTDLPIETWDQKGSKFYIMLMDAIVAREDIGALLAEGVYPAAEKWGQLGDLANGTLKFPQWGYPEHYSPQVEVEWPFNSVLGDRDINDHGINFYVRWFPQQAYLSGHQPYLTADELVTALSKSTAPYNDPMLWDYSEGNIYSDNKIKSCDWIRNYNLFWKNSIQFCDYAWPNLLNLNVPDRKGLTPDYEPAIFNAVTGSNISFVDGMEIGRRIWNLDRAIYILQGRHRDLEKFAPYVYKVPSTLYLLPVYKDGKWEYGTNEGRTQDEKKFEDWKTRYFEFQGWDSSTGWPKRETLEKMGMKNVADELDKQGKLGK